MSQPRPNDRGSRASRGLGIRRKAQLQTAAVCGMLAVTLVFSTLTFRNLERLTALENLAGTQLTTVLETRGLLDRVVAGEDKRAALQRKIESYETTLQALLEGGSVLDGELELEAITHGATREALHVVAADWKAFANRVDRALAELNTRDTASAASAASIGPLLAGLTNLERRYVRADEDEYEYHIESVQLIRQEVERIQNGVYRLLALPNGDELQQTVLALEISLERCMEHALALADGSDELELDPTEDAEARRLVTSATTDLTAFGDLVDALTASKVALAEDLERLERDLETLHASQLEACRLMEGRAASGLRSFRILQTSMLLAAILVTLLGAWLIRNQVVRPIRRASALMQEIAHGDGDLTARLGLTSRDEIGELSHWFDQFVAKTQAIIADVLRSVHSVNDSAVQVDGAANAMQATTTETHSRAGELSQHLDGMNRSLRATTERITASSDEVSRSVTHAVDVAARAHEQLDVLVRSSQRIESVLSAIDEIAEKTRMLSINASVEAARAGEAGRGFAVVSEEVKSLADQTAGQTHEINEALEVVRSSSRDMLAALKGVSDVIAEANERQSDSTSAIVQSMSEVSSTSEELRQSMAELSRKVEESSTTAQTTLSHASALSRISSALQSAASQFHC